MSQDCLFCKIVEGTIPADKVHEDGDVIAFRDIAPQAPVHVLIIPKGAYLSSTEFSQRASDAEIAGFTRAIAEVARREGVAESGYRLIANAGANGHQEVPHFHMHLLGGRRMGRMVQPA